MKTKKERARGGITLIEMMMAVAIIGVLILIAIPSYQRIQRSSKISKAKSELGMLQTAVEYYYVRNNNTYPGALSDVTAMAASPLKVMPTDPFTTEDSSYGYALGGTAYYVMYSIGPDGNGAASVDAAGTVTETGGLSCIFVSNAEADATGP